MKFIDYIELLEDLIDIAYEEECVSVIADTYEINELMSTVCTETDIAPDFIQYDSEKDSYWYFSIETNDEEELVFSVYEAVKESGEEFYPRAGIVFVHDEVPEEYESSVSLKNMETIRFGFYGEDNYCNGDCKNCDEYIADNDETDSTIIERDKNGDIVGFTKTWESFNDGVFKTSTITHRSNNEESIIHMLKMLDIKF